MFFPNYKEIIINNTTSQTNRKIIFDKVWIRIYGDAKYSTTEIQYHLNSGYRRRNIDLSIYIKAVNDYLISHPFYGRYNNKVVNVFNFECIKFLEFEGLKFSSNEFEIIDKSYPNIYAVRTTRCTIYKEALIGCIKCNYYDYLSDIMTLDSFDGFSGQVIHLDKTHIINKNNHVLNLLCNILTLEGVNLDYERFFLSTNAPKIRKLEIHRYRSQKLLSNKDLLFISGFFNLEYIDINGIIDNYDQIKKLEKLRMLKGLLQSNNEELEKIKKQRMTIYLKLKENEKKEEVLKNYLMYQSMIIQNKYLDFIHKLYVPRLDRIKWENKIAINDLEKIREELINISNMLCNERKNISCESKEPTFFDSTYGLNFDRVYSNDEDYILQDSRPFEGGGIKYYVKNKKIIRD